MIKKIAKNIMYMVMKNRLERLIVECGGLNGEADKLYTIMWGFICADVFTEEQSNEIAEIIDRAISDDQEEENA